MAKWRRHKREFKRQVVDRMKTCDNIQALASELDLGRKLLYTWKYQFEGRPESRHASYVETPETMERKLKAAKIAGPHATPKGLRHGFGVKAVTSGIPLNMVQKRLGHAQLSTTSIYAEAVGAEAKQIAARMW